jgi:hypothetical protein
LTESKESNHPDFRINPLLLQLHMQNKNKGGIVQTGQLLDRHRFMMQENNTEAIPKVNL